MHCEYCNKSKSTQESKESKDGYLAKRPSFYTKAIHVAQNPERWESRAVVTPIINSTTFKQPAPGEPYEFDYARAGNPTRNTLEACLASLESAKHAVTFASGIGVITSVYLLLSTGDHLICCDDVYGGTYQLFTEVVRRMGIEVEFVDCTVLEKLERAIKPNTRMIWAETPSNPMMKVINIAGVSNITRKHGHIILVVDNTFLTPYLQRPLDFGADIVIYSVTKYMNGHSDVLMGSATTNNDDLAKRLRFIQFAVGGVPSPFDCYFVLRGVKTLGVRMERLQKNGLIVANWLKNNPHVKRVLHPGLSEHPGHDITKIQTAGHSSCFSFEHKGGVNESVKLLNELKIFSLAVSLGGYESMAQLPCTMTHAALGPELRKTLGISDALIRIAIGMEDTSVLIDDLDKGFKAAFGH